MTRKLKIKLFKPLRFKVTPYSILAEDLNDVLNTVLERELPLMGKSQRDRLIDILYDGITLVLTEDIDFES